VAGIVLPTGVVVGGTGGVTGVVVVVFMLQFEPDRVYPEGQEGVAFTVTADLVQVVPESL
jgi:hypothetical protein